MPVIDGIDLATLLHRDGPMSPQLAVKVIEQLASALDTAHAAGLVHRDIKPSNALMAHQEFVYLIDFGIAHDESATKLTQTGSVLGTLAYMAPERFETGIAKLSADVYALAALLHECLTGEQPFPGNSLPQQMHAHLYLDPPRPSSQRPDLPKELDAVVAKGMAKDPAQRYQSATELAVAAREALIAAPSPEPAPEPPPTQPAEPPATTPATTVPTPEPQSSSAPTQLAATHIDDSTQANIAEPAGDTPAQTRKRRALILITVLGAIAAVVIAIVAVDSMDRHREPLVSGPETVLPFTGLNKPDGVAIDATGAVYVADYDNNRVLKLEAGSGQQTVLPFTGLNEPRGVAVDAAGATYVVDSGNNRVLKLAPGSPQTELPFVGLWTPFGVAVDSAGAVYVTDQGHGRVLKVAARSTAQVELPFTGDRYPQSVAVDSRGAVYVTDGSNRRVLELSPGSTQQTVLPFTGLNFASGVAVDGVGAIYVADGGNRVVKLVPGSQQSELAFAGLNDPNDVAVDSAGAVYVSDSGNNRVLKLQQP